MLCCLISWIICNSHCINNNIIKMGSHLMFVHKNIAKLKHHNERQADKQELFMIDLSLRSCARHKKCFLKSTPQKIHINRWINIE